MQTIAPLASRKRCQVCIDDIFISGEKFEEHFGEYSTSVGKITQNQFHHERQKVFAVSTCKILGFHV